MNIDFIVGVAAPIVAFVTAISVAFFSIRRLVHWHRPIKIVPSIHLVFDDSGPEQILTTITNLSGEDQVIVKCQARSAYPVWTVLKRQLKTPRALIRYRRKLFYAPLVVDLMKEKSIRLIPKEHMEFSRSLSFKHPLSLFFTPFIQIEVELSNGRVFRSKRLEIPQRWRFIPKSQLRHSTHTEKPT